MADWPCVKLNPEPARRFAQATRTLAKTDRIDAILLARMAATLQPPVRPAKSAEQAQLAELINARDRLVRDRTALKNREKTSPPLTSNVSVGNGFTKSIGISKHSTPRSPT